MARWCTQSVLVRKGRGPGRSAKTAKAYAKAKGYRTSKIDSGAEHYRFRQKPVSAFKKTSFRTLCVSHNLCFVRGILKKGRC